ncbi:MAG TPA: S8 family serine peptidase [Longimicrobiales bacterium]|nr:S8 family serine peptidase [Longimicrobiales bacterium]
MRIRAGLGWLSGVVVVLIPLVLGAVRLDPDPKPSKLFKNARELLASARARGETEVTMLVAAKKGGAAAVAREAKRLGGEVRYRHDGVDYLRVRIPIDRASEFAEHARIESVTLDLTERELDFRFGTEGDPKAREVQEGDGDWPPRWSDRPLTQPYRAIRDIDGEEFQKKNPTFDGRGVTIALLDGHLDFLLPEFQTAYTLDGKRVPKLADMIITADPRETAEFTPQWVEMKTRVVANGGKVVHAGKTFTVPGDGVYRIGILDERRFFNASYLEQDLDRNGNPRGDDGKFGVLWDEKTNDVWVDTDRDLDFTDEKPMTDYRVRGDWGVFGKDDPKTGVRESVGFTVQTDRKNEFVAINVGIYQHATEIMGHVVGNEEPNGRLRGIAPGARIVSVFYGYSLAHGLIEGLIAAFEHPEVDIVVLEQSVAIASVPYTLADARHPISIIAQRLIERTGKLLTVPGDNPSAFGFVAEDGLAPGAISAGGYQHRDSYLMHKGFEPETEDNMHWGGMSHGPSGHGALKPDLLAPSGQISVDIGYVYRKAESTFRGLYQLPPGYFVDGGTSTAAPMAAGAAALVISAAKQTGLKYDAARLKAALTGSARQIANLQAHEQGNGLVQVEAAYELLKKLQDWTPIEIETRAPVRTRLSHLLQEPHTGVGLFEREGWTVGQRGTRSITFIRKSGPKEPMTFQLSWQGNDGTFRSPASVTLPLNRPVEVPVEIEVRSHGAHSAILSLTHPSIPGYVHRVLNAVAGALRPATATDYTVETELIVPRPGDRPFFVEVPEGTKAIRFTAASEVKGGIQVNVVSPGREMSYFSCPYGVNPMTCTIADPEPGVWEFNVTMRDLTREYDPHRERPVRPAPVKVSATLLGIELSADARPAAPARSGTSFDLPLTLVNRHGATPAALFAEPLASAYRTTRRIAKGEQHVYEIVVPEGATSVRASISGAAGADLDLYLLDCTTKGKVMTLEPLPEKEMGNRSPALPPIPCLPKAKDIRTSAGGLVELRDPAPGLWVVVVDAYAVPETGVKYSYQDAYHHPRFGAIAVKDLEKPRDSRARWAEPAHVWVAAEPEAGRTLLARLTACSKGAAAALGELEVPLGPDAPATVSQR